jgi:hypothetical protein
MALKIQLTKEEHGKLSPDLQKEYVAEGDVFKLSLDGGVAVPQTELVELRRNVGEFRTNNIALMQERDRLTADLKKFDGVDPAEYKDLKDRADKLKAKGVKDENDLPTLIANAIKPVAETVTELKTTLATERAEKATLLFESQIGDVATKAGVRPGSLRHVKADARDVFELRDGALVAKAGKIDADGKALTPDTWIAGLRKSSETSHLFNPSSGGGASGDPGITNPGVTMIDATDANLKKYEKEIVAGTVQVRQAAAQ